VVGAQTEADHEKIGSLSPVTFGYRELDPAFVLRVLGSSYASAEGDSMDGDVESGLSSVLRSEPVVPRAGGSYAQGPFVFANQNIIKFSEGQEATDERLASELLNLFRRRYPSYG
jgi:hypothetical protein